MKRFLPALLPLALLAAAPANAAPENLVSRLEALAASGSGEAAYHLGMIHHMGLAGAPKNPAKAFAQFKLAAERGDPLGAYKLGCFYAGQGEGVVRRDPKLALRWKLVAAEAGYALAQEEVAELYAGEDDGAKALPWFEAAARQGSPRALMTLGVLHDPKTPPMGAAKDPVKSLAYLMLFFNKFDKPEMAAARQAFHDEAVKRMSKSELEQAEAMIAGWREQPTPLTEKAGLGLGAAERMVRPAGGAATPPPAG
ncbi:MAG TPA: tetratricopeptide repeat protein [Allosphingosinicella sp.]|jgi:hypothetical protein